MKNKIKILLMCMVVGISSGCASKTEGEQDTADVTDNTQIESEAKDVASDVDSSNTEEFEYPYIESFENGNMYFEAEDYQSAIVEYNKAIDEYEGDKNELDLIQHKLGECYYRTGEYETAISVFEQSIVTKQSYGQENTDVFISHIAIADCYLMIDGYDKALENALIALDEYHNTKDKYGVDESYIFGRLSTIYYWLEDYNKSIEYANQIINYDTSNLLDEAQYKTDLMYAYSNMGDSYYEMENYEEAANAYEQAKLVAIENEDYYGAGFMIYYEADACEMMGDLDKTRKVLEDGTIIIENAMTSGYPGDLEYILTILDDYVAYLDGM